MAIRNKGIVIIKWERSSVGDIGGQFPGGEMDTSNPIRNGRLATGLRVIFIEAAIHPHFATPSSSFERVISSRIPFPPQSLTGERLLLPLLDRCCDTLFLPSLLFSAGRALPPSRSGAKILDKTERKMRPSISSLRERFLRGLKMTLRLPRNSREAREKVELDRVWRGFVDRWH